MKWLLLFLLLVLTIFTGTILYLMLSDGAAKTPVAETAKAPAPAAEPLYVKVGPMTVNLQGGDYGQRLLYIGLSLKTSDEKTRAALNRYMPELQSRLLILLSGQDGEMLISPAGKEQLATDVLGLLDTPFAPGQASLAVDAVLFTDFILQ